MMFAVNTWLLSVTHVNPTHFSATQADTSKKVTCMVDKLQTLHCQSEQSGRSGLGPITFLQTEHEHERFELIIRIDL